jgi:hypothetical protein
MLVGLICSSVQSQTNDFGLWTSFGAEKDLGKWNIGLHTEIRTKESSSQLNRLSYKLNADYNVLKPIKFGVAYKFIYFNDTEYSDFQPRQRYMAYLNGKQKFGRFKFSLREKVQRTIKDERDRIKESGNYDNYKINPEWIWRNRLKMHYNIPKCRINPAFSVETFYQLNNPDGNSLINVRYKLEFDYKLNKHNAFEIYGLLDNEMNVSNPNNMYVGGFKYVFTF